MAGQGSARVTLREIDLSQVRNPQQQPQGVPAAVVGPARKGPAFVPRTFANMQQFEEVFGSMRERGYQGNANLFGPMALNEWMRSASAGTYLRVLGVGDGLKSNGGKTTDAGFVVGAKQVQEQSNDLGKVGDNPHAAINDSDAALALGRTQFLGCFMKDSTGSNFLRDAGMASENTSASFRLEIDNGAQLAQNSFIEIIAVDDSGAQTSKLIGFNNGGNAINKFDGSGVELIPANRVIDITALNNSQTLIALLNLINAEFPNLFDHTVSQGNGIAALDISHKSQGESGNVTFDVRLSNSNANKIRVISGDQTVTNSQLSRIVALREGLDGTKSSAIITAVDAAMTEGATIPITGISGRGLELTVTFTFKLEATLNAEIDNDGDIAPADKAAAKADALASGFYRNVNTDNAITVLLPAGGGNIANNTGALENLLAAINSSGHLLAGVSLNFADVSGNLDGTELTLEQGYAGTQGDTALVFNPNGGDAALTVAGPGGTPDFFDSGENASASNIAMSLVGQPNPGDYFVFGAGIGGVGETRFAFVSNANGQKNSINTPLDLQNGLGQQNYVQIEIGENVDITLSNIRDALLNNDSGQLNTNEINVDLDAVANQITITSTRQDLSDNVDVTFGTSSNVGFKNNVNSSIIFGYYGLKQASFAGGGLDAAQPVIRGVLMTPQGVKATMDIADNLGADGEGVLSPLKDANLTQVRSAAHGKVFGSDPAANLIGYKVGKVSSQGFKIILNGYSNTQNPAVLNCSFNPDSPSYFAKVLNTDPTKVEELGHYLYAWWDVKDAVAETSNSGLLHKGIPLAGNYADMIGFLVEGASGRNGSVDNSKPNYENFESKFRTAKTPWIVSQFYGSAGDDAARPSSAKSGDALKLFRLHALDDGSSSNDRFRLMVSNLRYASDTEYGSFDMTLESWDSDPIKGTPIVAWKNASLDPMSNNFIGRLIGDKHVYFDFEKDSDKQRLREEGQYSLKNSYVRIELSDDLKRGNIPVDALPTGFQGHSTLFTKTPLNFVEDQADLGAARVFTANDDSLLDKLSDAQVLPMDYVVSINRQPLEGVFEADDDLAWGVKFGLREAQIDFISNTNRGHKENQEQVFNKSLMSWSKFFPDFGSNPAMLTDGDDTDLVQNSFFSLEKIEIPAGSLSNAGAISTWDGAMYRRDPSATPAGRFVNIAKDANVKNMRYLKFRCMFQGGFDGVNIFDEHKSEFSGTATLREGFDETGSSKFTGPTIMSYRRAVDVLSDKSAAEFQLLVLPGQRASAITDYAITACEDRFDALYLMDIVEKNDKDVAIEDAQEKANVRNTIREFSNRLLDTSFAAAYFPDVLMRRPSDNAPTLVPPSVGMLGALSRNDAIADPWFAPAGLNRGRLNAIDSKVQMTRDLLDELYDADINPIYVPAGRSGEVYAFGQKTLLQDQSALDRINVRRLLIDIRRKVRKVGEQLLFEPNRASTLARFSSLVEPIMANVQARRGVARYKVQIDASTTTQADVENNTIRGKIYLQPLKAVEFISLDFVVANNIE